MSSKAQKEALKRLKEQKKKMAAEEKKKQKEAARGTKSSSRPVATNGGRNKGGKSAKSAAQPQPLIGREISSPFNFSHDTHVGWDAQRGFELRNIPPEWIKMFKAAGATDSDLADPETRAILVNATVESMQKQGISPPPPAPAPPPAPTPPPPPPAPIAPPAPPPPSLGGSNSDPYVVGAKVKAVWSEDGQWYNAVIESVREVDGQKWCLVTFTEYGNQEEVHVDNIQIEKPSAPKSMADMLAEKANSLKSSEMRQLTPKEEESIIDSVQKALAARRAGMCISVYGHDAVAEEDKAEWEDQDDSWMDF